jgi:hypothetical protein
MYIFKTFLYNYSVRKEQNPKDVMVKVTNSNLHQHSATLSA